jgi:hypothetical protein
VRATEPSGRWQDADQEAHVTEKCCKRPCPKSSWRDHECCAANCNGRTHWSHPGDLPATATTRAKNRAISDLIGAGEVSAEEMTDEKPKARSQQPAGQKRPVGEERPIPQDATQVAIRALMQRHQLEGPGTLSKALGLEGPFVDAWMVPAGEGGLTPEEAVAKAAWCLDAIAAKQGGPPKMPRPEALKLIDPQTQLRRAIAERESEVKDAMPVEPEARLDAALGTERRTE